MTEEYENTVEDYDEFIDNKLVEQAEEELKELIEKYNITDYGIEAGKNRFCGTSSNLNNFLIEKEKQSL
jgi:hypothetical protein